MSPQSTRRTQRHQKINKNHRDMEEERMKNTSEKIDTKIPIDKFSDSQCLRGEQHDLTRKPKQ
jgi:hypothetical protein